MLTTILATDLVGSTERVQSLGDEAWVELLDRHHDAVRRELRRFVGEELDTAGDGFLAAFDGPARAIRCALAVREALRPLGLDVRAGIHTGEVERRPGDKPRGIAVHTCARVAALARGGECSSARRPTISSPAPAFAFDDRGEHELMAIEGNRRLFAVR